MRRQLAQAAAHSTQFEEALQEHANRLSAIVDAQSTIAAAGPSLPAVHQAATEQATTLVIQLHQMGVKISIDDFGTGYSSLAYLKQLPVDEIKIDRSFVMGMSRNGTVIVRSVIDLGRNLGLQITAEGVENREAWDTLARMGCATAQGYFLSRPLPAEDVMPWMATFQQTVQRPNAGNVILVVDDNPVYQELLQVLLTGEGYDVVTAGDADETLDVLQTRTPDLMLTDVQLPGMNGLDLVRRIRADEALRDTVIVAMTGAPRSEDEQHALSIGCDVYTAKPKSNADMIRLVHRYLAA
ncbi:MAG TPA: EAL domain-containing protein [Chloroflexota bacterium]